MKAVHHFALLAPVPLEHLQSGKNVAMREGFVAFGTRKFELLRKLDEMREGDPVPALIYPSGPLGMRHRPPTTAQYPNDNSG